MPSFPYRIFFCRSVSGRHTFTFRSCITCPSRPYTNHFGIMSCASCSTMCPACVISKPLVKENRRAVRLHCAFWINGNRWYQEIQKVDMSAEQKMVVVTARVFAPLRKFKELTGESYNNEYSTFWRKNMCTRISSRYYSFFKYYLHSARIRFWSITYQLASVLTLVYWQMMTREFSYLSWVNRPRT